MDRASREKLMDEGTRRRQAEAESYLSVPMIRETIAKHSQSAKQKGFKKITVKPDKGSRTTV